MRFRFQFANTAFLVAAGIHGLGAIVAATASQGMGLQCWAYSCGVPTAGSILGPYVDFRRQEKYTGSTI